MNEDANKVIETEVAEPETIEPTPEELERAAKLKEFEERDPEGFKQFQAFQYIANNVNQVANWLNGKAKLPEEVTDTEHAKYLATRYCQDVVFLLQQLGVIDTPVGPEVEEGVSEDDELVVSGA